MGVFKRLSDIISANIHHLLDRCEDPEKMCKQVVRELEVTLAQVRQAVVKAMAGERQLRHGLDQNRDIAAEWSQRAEQALGEGDEDLASRARGQNYITVFMDLAEDRRRVLFVTEGRDAGTVHRFRRDLEAHGGSAEQVEEACLDMSPAYIRGLTEAFPRVQLTFDQYHLTALLNQAVDEVRRQEQGRHPELKGTRYV